MEPNAGITSKVYWKYFSKALCFRDHGDECGLSRTVNLLKIKERKRHERIRYFSVGSTDLILRKVSNLLRPGFESGS